MNRRSAVAVVVLGLLLPTLPAIGQPGARKARIGFLSAGQPPTDPVILRHLVDPFRQGLRELGRIEGQNITIEYRWAEGKPERLPGLLGELIALEPDVLVSVSPQPARLAKEANSALPIVAVAGDNPIDEGLVTLLARPGGNITGVASSIGFEMIVKRLQALKEIVPAARRFAILINPNAASRDRIEENLPPLEKALDASVRVHEARGPQEYEGVFAAIARDRVDGIVILSDPTTFANRTKLQELCVAHRLPSAWGGRGYLEAGGLVSFQSDFAAAFRRAAALVDKILKGTKPGDIPFELPTKFELIVNLKAAKSLGLTIPQAVLLRADEVIE